MEISYDPRSGSGGSGIYLQNAFLRSENGKSYIWCADADGRLEQRFIPTGRSLWGSYTEILGGLGPNDRIAFPYGRDVRSGAATKNAGVDELYTYY